MMHGSLCRCGRIAWLYVAALTMCAWVSLLTLRQCRGGKVQTWLSVRSPAWVLNGTLSVQSTAEHPVLHVIIPYTNPQRDVRHRMLTEASLLAYQGLPDCSVYVIELVHGDDAYEIAEQDNPMHLRLRSRGPPIWQRENLINIAVARVLPADWKALAWIDEPITTGGTDWCAKALQALASGYDVIQLHEDDMTVTERCGKSSTTGEQERRAPSKNSAALIFRDYVWVMSREAFSKLGGLYEYLIDGTGNNFLMSVLVGSVSTQFQSRVPSYLKSTVIDFQARARDLRLLRISGQVVEQCDARKEYMGLTSDFFLRCHLDPVYGLERDTQGLLILTNNSSTQQQELANRTITTSEPSRPSLRLSQLSHEGHAHKKSALALCEAVTDIWTDGGLPAGHRYLVFMPLRGRRNESGLGRNEVETLSLRSWIRTAMNLKSRGKGLLRVMGLVDDPNHCYDDLQGEVFTCFALPSSCRHSAYNVSTLDCVFEAAMSFSEPMPPVFPDSATLIYVNGDILLEASVFDAISVARKKLGQRFVLVGRRHDIKLTKAKTEDLSASVDFHEQLEVLTAESKLHPLYGIDYFVFTRKSLPTPIPPFLTGRYRWDNALLQAFMDSGVPSVDISSVVKAFHVQLQGQKIIPHKLRLGASVNHELAQPWRRSARVVADIGGTAFLLKRSRKAGTAPMLLQRRHCAMAKIA